MSMTFTKLFSSITESTIWVEDDRTRLVWITMLAMCDRKGRVWASIPGLANRARVPVEDAERAVEKFLLPDKYSRTPDFEGKRIEIIDGGWRLLNHEKYRSIRDEEAILESKRNYINTRRGKERVSKGVEDVDRSRANAEAEAEAEAKAEKKPRKARRSSPSETDDEWIEGLKAKDCYKPINISTELGKAQTWAGTNSRKCTRQFFVNWLNRALESARTISTNGSRPIVPPIPPSKNIYESPAAQ